MEVAILLIRIGVGITMVIFGIHQFGSPHSWTRWIPDEFDDVLHIPKSSEVRLHSLGDILLGTLLMSGAYPLAIAWMAFLWWVFILPFAFHEDWQVGMRDLSITISLAALIFLLT